MHTIVFVHELHTAEPHRVHSDAIWTERKNTATGSVAVFCSVLPDTLVIRVGLEPTTPTLKVLCSTN